MHRALPVRTPASRVGAPLRICGWRKKNGKWRVLDWGGVGGGPCRLLILISWPVRRGAKAAMGTMAGTEGRRAACWMAAETGGRKTDIAHHCGFYEWAEANSIPRGSLPKTGAEHSGNRITASDKSRMPSGCGASSGRSDGAGDSARFGLFEPLPGLKLFPVPTLEAAIGHRPGGS